MIIFFIVFIYIVINIILYFSKEHIAIYEVVEKTIADDNTCQGIVLRKEQVVSSKDAGYVNYYIKDGEKVGKNTIVYTLDESGSIAESLSDSTSPIELTSKDISAIRNEIQAFNMNYTTSNYSEVYNLKYDLENSIFDLTNYHLIQNVDSLANSKESGTVFDVAKSEQSGIVSYYVDGMENLTADDITLDTFQTDSYNKIQLRTNNLIEKDTPIYKMVTSEDWAVVLNITKEQYDKIQEKNSLKVIFLKDNLTISAPVKVYQKGDGYFALLTLDSYMVRYVDDRFIDVEININSASGLKIPVSAITTKEFFKVPLDYFTTGGDSNAKCIKKETYSENGEKKYNFIPTEIYYQDEEFGYIDKNVVSAGDSIRNADTNETYQITETDKLEGVYNVNKGYCVFRRIEKVYENQEYCIVKKDTDYGLSVYDHIVLDAKTAVEQKIIY
jgi:hypothetical protein